MDDFGPFQGPGLDAFAVLQPIKVVPGRPKNLKEAVLLLLIARKGTPVPVLWRCTALNRQIRLKALQNEVWEPVLERMGVAKLGVNKEPSPLSILGCGYTGDAYSAYIKIAEILHPFVLDPTKIDVYTHPIEYAQVLANTLRYAQTCTDLEAQIDILRERSASTRARALHTLANLFEANAIDSAIPQIELFEALNDGEAAFNLYTSIIPLLHQRVHGTLELIYPDEFENEQLQTYLSQSADTLNEIAIAVARLFPSHQDYWNRIFTMYGHNVLVTLMQAVLARARSSNTHPDVAPLVTTAVYDFVKLIDESQEKRETVRNFVIRNFSDTTKNMINQQLPLFAEAAKLKVEQWKNGELQRETETHERYFGSLAKQTDKKTFLFSFKRALRLDSSGPDSRQRASTEEMPPTPTVKEAETALIIDKIRSIETLVSMDLTLAVIDDARLAINRVQSFAEGDATLASLAKSQADGIFVELINAIGNNHVEPAFDKALDTLRMFKPQTHATEVEPLKIFSALVNAGDLIQQTVQVFFEEQLVVRQLVDRDDFVAPSLSAKRRFEQRLDDKVAVGLSLGIDVMINQVDFVLITEQLASEYLPPPGTLPDLGPTATAKKVVELVRNHTFSLRGSIDDSLLEVFEQEVGLRLFHSICKHIKHNRVNLDGAIVLISDINYYYEFVLSLKQKKLYPYYEALKQVGQLFLIDPKDGKQLGLAIADMKRFHGVMPTEELLEFMRRREDWPLVRGRVEHVLYGLTECIIS